MWYVDFIIKNIFLDKNDKTDWEKKTIAESHWQNMFHKKLILSNFRILTGLK